MRIDYNEPRKSYSSTPVSPGRPRKESTGSPVLVAIVSSAISLVIGFGGGWMLSQRSAKKAFKAAMEQKSLENSPRAAMPPQLPSKPLTAAPQAPAPPQQPQTEGAQSQPAASAPAAPGSQDPPLSFYKNLPSGQKSNVLGSGINARDEKPSAAKQPLQAAIPANLTRPPQPPATVEAPRPAPPAPVEKAPARPESSGFTVQVASYSLKSEADALKGKLAGKGYNAYIVDSNQGDKGIWYRVRVGKGMEQDAARELAGKLGKGALAIPDKN